MTDKPEHEINFPRTERYEAPLYLAKYLERQAKSKQNVEEDGDDSLPLYLRQFRQRRDGNSITEQQPPLYQRVGLAMQQSMSEDNRTKEISAPPEARSKLAADVYLIRHGETQGYSTEAGLTPSGTWQAHTYGHTISKRVSSGETIVLRHAATNRAGQTAIHVHKGLTDGLAMFEKDVKVFEPAPMEEFRNFQVATPDGLRDVTAAFRQYYATLEEFERTALGDRPMWLVEVDRFWRTQSGGSDPIQHWLQIPMMHFEPPAMVVRRFWQGIRQLADEYPGARLLIATHSGPIRAFAITAFGYDPGEPYNTEHVRVKLREGSKEALVSYRNRVQEIHVPEIDSLPTWQLDEQWVPQ
ncbi:MAG: histidine phosphatase family protein [Actinobacteria bacterium]|nr:histidine phosphatase family protein [Actinomycetota bacterium]